MQKIYKSDTDKMLDGVCGGIAQYFRVDPVIVRLLWVVGTIIGHIVWGVFAYFVAMIIIPRAPHSKGTIEGEQGSYSAATAGSGNEQTTAEEKSDIWADNHGHDPGNRRTHMWLGVGLIALGGLFLIQNISDFHVLSYLGQIFPYVWPAILIILGIMLMMRTSGREEK